MNRQKYYQMKKWEDLAMNKMMKAAVCGMALVHALTLIHILTNKRNE